MRALPVKVLQLVGSCPQQEDGRVSVVTCNCLEVKGVWNAIDGGFYSWPGSRCSIPAQITMTDIGHMTGNLVQLCVQEERK